MKRILSLVLVVMLSVLCLSGSALAASDDCVLITSKNGAVLYNTHDRDKAQPIAKIPFGSAALYIATVDWGYCVTFGNYAGYIHEDDGVIISSDYVQYLLPTGKDYSYSSGGNSSSSSDSSTDLSYVPEFPFEPIDCELVEEDVSTRSGPNSAYTWQGHFSPYKDYTVLYQTKREGVVWGYVEFEEEGFMYRLYTAMWRITADETVPYSPDDTVTARITKSHTPLLGPGYEYAYCNNRVSAGKVKALYQQDGWLMFECTLSNGTPQRGWAPPGYWK